MNEKDAFRQSRYLIQIKERISPQMSSWFEDTTVISNLNGETTILSSAADQAALYGLLFKLRDLNLTLISISKIEDAVNLDHIAGDRLR